MLSAEVVPVLPEIAEGDDLAALIAPHVLEAASRAWLADDTDYTANAGIAPLREAIAAKLRRVNGMPVEADQVWVTPGATEALAVAVSAATGRLRTLDLQKSPGTAEVIDWVQALHVLGLPVLDAAAAETTIGSVLKYREDRDLALAAGLGWVVGE